MSVHILTIPFDPEKEIFQDEDLTDFLLNKKIKTLRPEFFQLNGRAYWTVFVEYKTILDDKVQAVKMSQSKALNDAQKLLFQRFREWKFSSFKRSCKAEFISLVIIIFLRLMIQRNELLQLLLFETGWFIML
ncbi:hypothetical protein GMMP1_990018 [Candidatus Magnetomoraceae bacterium gMMP-1]